MDKTIGALILAAGKGTRMHSALPKVLHTLLGEPMLGYVHAALEPLFADRVWTVVGHGAEAVEQAFPEQAARFVLQAEQLGTGHALQVAWDALESAGLEHVLVINGDTPLIPTRAVADFVEKSRTADLAFMTLTLEQENAFGRVVRRNGDIRAIIEVKDYDSAQYGPESGEVNAGIYCLRMGAVKELLSGLSRENNSGEYYITDLIEFAVRDGLSVLGVDMGGDEQFMGINSPAELVAAEECLRRNIVSRWLDNNVLIRNPDAARIGPRVLLEPGADLCGPCELYGATEVRTGAMVASFTWIKDSLVDQGADVRNFSHLEGARVGPGCWVGPYARLRPGAVLEQDSRVGNFVELKKAVLGRGAKASHLTYLGDAEVGEETNIGAGTITCNYDGKNKHKTIIGKNAFIGSNTALVAPVTVGDQALVGAGSTITKNVPEKSMGIARGRQKNLPRK